MTDPATPSDTSAPDASGSFAAAALRDGDAKQTTAALPWTIKILSLLAALHVTTAIPQLLQAITDQLLPLYTVALDFVSIGFAWLGVYAASNENRRLTRLTSSIALAIATPAIRAGAVFTSPTVLELLMGVTLPNEQFPQKTRFIGLNLVSLVLLILVILLTSKPKAQIAAD